MGGKERKLKTEWICPGSREPEKRISSSNSSTLTKNDMQTGTLSIQVYMLSCVQQLIQGWLEKLQTGWLPLTCMNRASLPVVPHRQRWRWPVFPSQSSRTTWGFFPPKRRPPLEWCAGRGPRRTSRSSCKPKNNATTHVVLDSRAKRWVSGSLAQ